MDSTYSSYRKVEGVDESISGSQKQTLQLASEGLRKNKGPHGVDLHGMYRILLWLIVSQF